MCISKNGTESLQPGKSGMHWIVFPIFKILFISHLMRTGGIVAGKWSHLENLFKRRCKKLCRHADAGLSRVDRPPALTANPFDFVMNTHFASVANLATRTALVMHTDRALYRRRFTKFRITFFCTIHTLSRSFAVRTCSNT